MRKVPAIAVLGLVCAGFLSAPGARAEEEEFYCEVLSVEGTAYLNNAQVYGQAIREGDLLKADDEVETAEGSSLDLAFDKDWSNVTSIEEKSRVKVRSVFPTRLYIDQGALYAKLKSLPKDSVFQVETPTAIAAVRGTEYRTEYKDGETSVSNDSEAETSQVYVYEADADGELRGDPVVLPRTQFTGVAFGARPRPPRPMNAVEKERCQKARGIIDRRVREQVARGRVAKIQDVQAMERFNRERGKGRGEARRGRQEERLRRDDRYPGGPQDPPGGSGHDRPMRPFEGDRGPERSPQEDGRRESFREEKYEHRPFHSEGLTPGGSDAVRKENNVRQVRNQSPHQAPNKQQPRNTRAAPRPAPKRP